MCKWHWRKVSPVLKASVLETWRNMQAGMRLGPARLVEKLNTIRAYQAARAAAVADVCQQEGLRRVG